MQIGMMGLGRMGANMVRRLQRDGHDCVVYDINPASVEALVKEGATGAGSLEDFIGKLAKPRAVWLMLPAAITGKVADQVAALLDKGDIIIDGGNSNYRDAVDLGARYAEKGLAFVDVGTSGGVWGLERGYCLMIGGDKDAVERLDRDVVRRIPFHPGRGPGGRLGGIVHGGVLRLCRVTYGQPACSAKSRCLSGAHADMRLGAKKTAYAAAGKTSSRPA